MTDGDDGVGVGEPVLIERAIGVLLAQGADDAAEAQRLLRRAAERAGQSMGVAAGQVIERVRRHPVNLLPAQVAETFSELRTALTVHPGPDVLRQTTALAVARIPGASSASVTLLRQEKFTTVAATGPTAVAVDELQYRHQEGPCLDALAAGASTFVVNDLAHDGRWPLLSASAAGTGVGAILSYRLSLETDEQVTASLNIYADRTEAFDNEAVLIGTLLASHAGGALLASYWQNRVAGIQEAVGTNREIGMAMGILMAQHRITRDAAFDLLRVASQHTNRKLKDVALDVSDTGTLDLPGSPDPLG